MPLLFDRPLFANICQLQMLFGSNQIKKNIHNIFYITLKCLVEKKTLQDQSLKTGLISVNTLLITGSNNQFRDYESEISQFYYCYFKSDCILLSTYFTFITKIKREVGNIFSCSMKNNELGGFVFFALNNCMRYIRTF